MPAKVTANSSGGYSVRTPNGVHAKNTTLGKAKAQQRLLNAVDHGWKPTGKPAMKKSGMKKMHKGFGFGK